MDAQVLADQQGLRYVVPVAGTGCNLVDLPQVMNDRD